jgi:hypothetical protein
MYDFCISNLYLQPNNVQQPSFSYLNIWPLRPRLYVCFFFVLVFFGVDFQATFPWSAEYQSEINYTNVGVHWCILEWLTNVVSYSSYNCCILSACLWYSIGVDVLSVSVGRFVSARWTPMTPTWYGPVWRSGVTIWWSLSRKFEPRCWTWEPVLRMRLYKPRSRVATGVARKRALIANDHKVSIGLNFQPCHR